MMNTHFNKSNLHIIPIPAFEDNYIWLLHNQSYAVVVDPGESAQVIQILKEKNLLLSAILITHHHADHIGGVVKLLNHQKAPVYAPSYEKFAFEHIPLLEGDCVKLTTIEQQFKVMHLPGHTLGHIAYVNDDYLFCGDTLFGAGCGRLFEGTPAQMLHSLQRIKSLNPSTNVFCTHEYTAKNIAFALTLDPDNDALKFRQLQTNQLRLESHPTLPSTLALELATNPFLRCNQTAIIKYSGAADTSELSVFSSIRTLRNHY
jgi:hydroxyacylglutathione hydrolase